MPKRQLLQHWLLLLHDCPGARLQPLRALPGGQQKLVVPPQTRQTPATSPRQAPGDVPGWQKLFWQQPEGHVAGLQTGTQEPFWH
jgi:hypothetical protein